MRHDQKRKRQDAEAGSSQEAYSCYEVGNGRVQVAFIEHLRGIGDLQHSTIASVACHTTQAYDCLNFLNMLNCASRFIPATHAWQVELARISEPVH